MVSFQIIALRWGRVSHPNSYGNPEKTSSINDACLASSRVTAQNDAGTRHQDWHKSDTACSTIVRTLSDWKNNRWDWKRAVRRDARLSDGAKVLAAALCDDFARHETGFCNPSIGTLAKALGKSDRSVQRALAELRKFSWCAVIYAIGRGRQSEILFQTGDGIVSVFDAEKTPHLSDRRTERVTEVSPIADDLQAERVTPVALKGDRGVTPYNKAKPKNNLKERASVRDQVERPYPQCCKVAFDGSSHEVEWNAWLGKNGFPTLQELDRRSSNSIGRGWDVPYSTPPSPDEETCQRITTKFFDWCAYQKGFVQ